MFIESNLRDQIFLLAERQHGVITRQQILDSGLSRGSLQGMLAKRALIFLDRGVYRVAGAPQTWEQTIISAWLAASNQIRDVAVGYRTAAAIHGLPGYARDGRAILVTARGDRETSRQARVITCTDLRSEDIATLPSGLRITSPLRTVFDLGLKLPNPARLDRLLDRSLLDKIVAVPLLWDLVTHTEGSGKRGIVRMRAALEARSGAYVPLESELEHLAIEALTRFGVVGAVRQHPLPGAPFGRVDLAFSYARLIIELDGGQHNLPSSRQADYERDVTAAREGWLVLRFTWSQVKFSPDWFAQSVADVLRARRALFHPAA